MRVDMYDVDGQVYFGELTLVPDSGFTCWNSVELDFRFGKLIRL